MPDQPRPAAARRRRPLLIKLIMALCAVGLFFVGYQWGNQWQARGDRPPLIGGVLVLPPRQLAELDLHASADGQPVGLADLHDRWTLVALASPVAADGHLGVARMVGVANHLAGDDDLRRRLGLWLVSSDDAPALARDFARLDAGLRLLTGAPAAVDALAAALGAGPGPDADRRVHPDVDATPTLFLIDPQARLLALFPSAQPAAAVAADITALARWPGPPAATMPSAQAPEPPPEPVRTWP